MSLRCGSGGGSSHRMDDDPSGQAAESAHCAADARHRGETRPRADLIVHARTLLHGVVLSKPAQLAPLVAEASALARAPNE